MELVELCVKKSLGFKNHIQAWSFQASIPPLFKSIAKGWGKNTPLCKYGKAAVIDLSSNLTSHTTDNTKIGRANFAGI